MDQIYNKINNHKYLNNEDIKRIIDVQTDGKVKALFVDSDDFGKSFHSIDYTIRIGKKDNFRMIKFFIKDRKLKLKVVNPNNPSTFLVDLYNLYLLFEIFHEIEHSKQEEKFNKSTDSKNKLIKKTSDYISINRNMYEEYHDLYYIEYQAVINPVITILDLIDNKFSNLNKRSIIEFNNQIARIIYHSYGNKEVNNTSKLYNRFCYPMCYTKFLSKHWSTPDERKLISICITDLKKNSKTEYQKLVNGLPLSSDTLDYIYDVCARNRKTYNLLEDIKKDKKKIK